MTRTAEIRCSTWPFQGGAEVEQVEQKSPCSTPLPLKGVGGGGADFRDGSQVEQNQEGRNAVRIRKPISKKLRFTIFERDGFRCRYCGASGDDVVLHIDHRLAVANGGTNDPENLTTACIDCNLGKGARELTLHPGTSQSFAEGWPQDIEDPVFFVSGNWAVTGYGLECLSTFYPIEADRLGEKRPGTDMADWLVHLAEKEWVALDYEAFVEAFLRALKHHRTISTFDLEKSLRIGRQEAADTRRSII